ncbi:Aste57867_12483 [Aphanomyces stellatus]|uniref:Aste57867_12483 protein n=1 Tax=Aphanomyces stellatus TaxID=120398 RepID=A0A485KVN4_9STRA|nr:hypothetical protein As57867_012437 [Aphanomyces stellatus]VFT89334.1 Aste57867_12483 [Aphanomyces stellatus]
MPVLAVDSVVFSESHAIQRYAASITGLYPIHDPLLALRVDEFVDVHSDIVLALTSTMSGDVDAATLRATREALATTTLPSMLALLDARLSSAAVGMTRHRSLLDGRARPIGVARPHSDRQ